MMEATKKIEHLRKIKPNSDYAAFSKLLILNPEAARKEISPEIAERLSSLRSITPSANFALATRLSIFEAARAKQPLWQNVLRQFVNYSSAVGVAVVVIAIVAGASKYFSSPLPILSDADNEDLLKEADSIAKDIDIHLEEINYYALTAEKTAVALNEAGSTEAEHSNNHIINREANSANSNYPARNTEIDNMLNQASM